MLRNCGWFFNNIFCNLKVNDEGDSYNVDYNEVLCINSLSVLLGINFNSTMSIEHNIEGITNSFIEDRAFIKELKNKVKASDFLIIYYLCIKANSITNNKHFDNQIMKYLNVIRPYYKTNKYIDDKIKYLLNLYLPKISIDNEKVNQTNDSLLKFMIKNKGLSKEDYNHLYTRIDYSFLIIMLLCLNPYF